MWRKSLISRASSPGSSAGPKWPPVGITVQRCTLYSRSAHSRGGLPSNSAFWSTYARGTYQNMAVMGQHYSFLQRGCLLFRLTPRPFDTRRLRDGVYDLVVTATDIRGNHTSLTRRFTVHNRAGWIGS